MSPGLVLVLRLFASVGLGYIVWFVVGLLYDMVFKDRD